MEPGQWRYFDFPITAPAGYNAVMVTVAGNGYNGDGMILVTGYHSSNVAMVYYNKMSTAITRTVSIDVLFKK